MGVKRRDFKNTLLYRPKGGDRVLQSIHDWYGLGILFTLVGSQPRQGARIYWYCGESAAMDQFKRGARYGRLLLEHEAQA